MDRALSTSDALSSLCSPSAAPEHLTKSTDKLWCAGREEQSYIHTKWETNKKIACKQERPRWKKVEILSCKLNDIIRGDVYSYKHSSTRVVNSPYHNVIYVLKQGRYICTHIANRQTKLLIQIITWIKLWSHFL